MRKLVIVLQVAFVQYGLDLTRARLHKQLKVKWQPFVPEDFLWKGYVDRSKEHGRHKESTSDN